MNHIGIVAELAFVLLGMDLSDVVEANKQQLARIHSLHVKTELCEGSAGQREGKVLAFRESWKVGLSEKESVTMNEITDKDGGNNDVQGNHRFRSTSASSTEIRSTANWDPANPPKNPLNPGRDMKEFESIKSGIVKRDPSMPCGMTWHLMLLEPTPGKTLAEFVAESKVQLLEVTDEKASLKIEATKAPNLQDAVIDLSPKHGYLIERITYSFGMEAIVDKFQQIDGVWIPMSVRRATGPDITIGRVTEIEVNKPIAESDLIVNFPEGARVDVPDRNLIQIWGKNEPAKSFGSYEKFTEYIDDSMRDAATSGGAIPPTQPKTRSMSWFYVINISALIVFVLARRWIKR